MNTILLIEDDEMLADNIASILELANYKVVTALDGRTGVILSKKLRPDLILCDIMMPGLDGYHVLQVLHSDNRTANIPFVFLTGKASFADYEIGMQFGADAYVTKPFDDIHLLNLVESNIRAKTS